MRELGQELLRYDALRETFEPEMARLHKVVEGVGADLEGHQATIQKLRLDLERERKVCEEQLAARDEKLGGMGEDLEGHKRLVSELKGELAEYEKVCETLKQDLAGHRETAKALAEDLERERGQFQAGVAALTQDLDGHRAMVKELQAMRDAELAEMQSMIASLAEREREIQKAHGNLNQALVQVTELEVVREHGSGEKRSDHDPGKSLEGAAASLREELQRLMDERDSGATRIEELEVERAALQEQAESLGQGLQSTQGLLAAEQQRRARLAAEINRWPLRWVRKLTGRKLDLDLLDPHRGEG